MAVTQAVEQDAQAASPKNGRAPRLPGAAWSSPAQLWRSLPMIRLLAEVWTIPQVSKVGLRVDGSGMYLHVVMSVEDEASEYRIYDAERDYLNTTAPHSFDLMVTPLGRIPEAMRITLLDGYAIILER